MRSLMLVIFISAALSGCSAKREVAGHVAPALAEARVEHKRAAWIAYEHAIELDVPAGRTRQMSDAGSIPKP